jgi:cysteate synthase
MSDYQLVCSGCNATYQDDGARLDCANDHRPALLKTRYPQRAFTPGTTNSMLRYSNWLPNAREFPSAARTGVYRSTALGPHLGLRQLWIAFSGWWPARAATLPTGSFKDLEAVSVLRRLAPGDARTLVISSAGNTALAFARICTDNNVPALIVVPLRGWRDVMSSVRVGPSVRIIAIADAGYQEAITFARDLCSNEEFILEGGVRNIGRRDGMGTAMLAAVETIGALPDAYFQAVGSAAGALAAHEAAQRINADGRYGTRLPRLMLSQNAPFTPIHDAWEAHRTTLIATPPEGTASRLAQIGAFVLGNAAPPYAATGGVHEALAASGGKTYAIGNPQFGNAMSLFAELEGMEIEPAAGVAVASLVRAVADGDINQDDVVVLHITGGGRSELGAETDANARPAMVLALDELATTAIDRTRSLLAGGTS